MANTLNVLRSNNTKRNPGTTPAPSEPCERQASAPCVRLEEAERLKQSLLSFVECFRTKHNPISHFHERGVINFKEARMNVHGFADELDRLYQSFPDFYAHDDDIQVIGPNEISVVLQVSGTHTGAPYSFGPFPEIAPKSIKVHLDPERYIFTYLDGKIIKLEVEPFGEITGPPGFYTQIGGLIF